MSESPIPLETPIDEVRFTVLDTETTGSNPAEGHEIVEIGMVHFSGGRITDSYETLVRPDRPLSPEALATHGIPVDELDRAPAFEAIVDDFTGFIADTVIVAHNVNFDMTYIHTALRRLGRPILHNRAVDTILLSQRTWPELSCHCLICLGSSLSLPHEGSHRALEDVYATTALLERIIIEMAKRGRRTLADLNPFSRDYTWGDGEFYRALERGLRCAIRRKALIHLYLYDKKECVYFRKTVEPLRLREGILRARVLGEEKESKYPLYDIIKVVPKYTNDKILNPNI